VPDSHLDARRLHLRVLALERDVPKQTAICLECSERTRKKLDLIAAEIGRIGDWASHAEEKIKAISKDICRKRK